MQITICYKYKQLTEIWKCYSYKQLTEIHWYKNNELQPAYNNSKSISISELINGNVWYVTIKPFDGIYYGNIVISPKITYEFGNLNIFSHCLEYNLFRGNYSSIKVYIDNFYIKRMILLLFHQ